MDQVAATLLVVIVVIPVGDRFVLVEESKPSCRGQWALPGGLVEQGECIGAAARRESREEAGIDVVPRGILAIYQDVYAGATKNPYMQRLRFIVVADAASSDLKTVADGESLRAKLYTWEEMPSLKLRDASYAKWIETYRTAKSLLPIESFHFEALI